VKILLTGASGFIGQNYLESTINKQITTISSSNFYSKKVYCHIKGDLADLDFLKKVAKHKYDVIIHAAWVGLPERTNDLNSKNLIIYKNIINILSETPETNHIFLGSCLEYGGLKGVTSEDTIGIDIDDFGQKKIDLLNYIKVSGIKFNWIRVFYTYGKYQHRNALINVIQKNIHSNQKIKIQNPNKTHDFIYIKDLISLIDKISIYNLDDSVFNCGSGYLTSVADIANNILGINGKAHRIQAQNELGLVADISKANKILNWEPKYSLIEGLSETLKGGNID
jgi:UDP-glucose 4-epimerase